MMMLNCELMPRVIWVSPADVNRDVSGRAVRVSNFDVGSVDLNYFSVVRNDQVGVLTFLFVDESLYSEFAAFKYLAFNICGLHLSYCWTRVHFS